MCLFLSVWSVFTPPRTSASLVWYSSRSRSPPTAGRTGAGTLLRHDLHPLGFVGCTIASSCLLLCLPTLQWDVSSGRGGVLSKERNRSFNNAVVSLWHCIRPKVPPWHPKPVLVCPLVGLVYICSGKHWTCSASGQQHKSFQFWSIHSRKKKGIKSWSSMFWWS